MGRWDQGVLGHQQSVTVTGKQVFLDEDGDYWTADQLIPVDADPNPNAKPVEAYSTFQGVFDWGWKVGVRAAIAAIEARRIAIEQGALITLRELLAAE